jgi:hypothetical protein
MLKNRVIVQTDTEQVQTALTIELSITRDNSFDSLSDCQLLYDAFPLSEEEGECPDLRTAGYATTLRATYVTECSVIKYGGNKSLQNACIHLPDCTVSQPRKEQSK